MGRDLQSKARAFALLFGAVFALAFVLTAWLTVGELRIVAALQSRGVAVQGEVFDYVRKEPSGQGLRGMGPAFFVPLFRFRTAEGQEVTVESNAGLKDDYPLGPYPVRYLPDDPSQARFEDFPSMWLWIAILSSGSALLVLVTALTFRAAGKLR
jgi:hypothetical protein